jgi:hypothetical protein
MFGTMLSSAPFKRPEREDSLRSRITPLYDPWDGFLEMTQLPVLENGHLRVGDIQVAVVVN